MNNQRHWRRLALFTLMLVVLNAAFLAGRQPAAADAEGQTEALRVAPGAKVYIRLDPQTRLRYVAPPTSLQAFQDGKQAEAATIIVNYKGTGWTTPAQNAFQYAVDIWKTLITSSVPIVVDAEFGPLPPGILGGAGPENFYRDFSGAPQAGTWYPVALANKLHGSDLDSGLPNPAEIGATFSSSFSDWHFDTSTPTPGNKINFASVVLHELGHGLGFTGSMTVDNGSGASECNGTQGVGCWGWKTGFPAVYDRFVENFGGTSLLSYANNSSALGTQLTGENLFFDGPNSRTDNGGYPLPLYAPGSWAQGSSYAHLAEDYDGTPHALMTYSIAHGETIYNPGSASLCLFKDMGWTVNDSCGGSPVQNHDFESGRTGWNESSSNGWQLIFDSSACPGPDCLPVAAVSGTWAAWLGGGDNEVATLEQTMTVPVGRPWLVYSRWTASAEDNCTTSDVASMVIGGSVVVDSYALCSSQATNKWQEVGVNLSAYAGENVSVTFKISTNADQTSNLYLEDVSFSWHKPLPEKSYLPSIVRK